LFYLHHNLGDEQSFRVHRTQQQQLQKLEEDIVKLFERKLHFGKSKLLERRTDGSTFIMPIV
jgi:hypothetical protein